MSSFGRLHYSMMPSITSSAFRRYVTAAVGVFFCLFLIFSINLRLNKNSSILEKPTTNPEIKLATEIRDDIWKSAQYYLDYPLPNSAFGEMGSRTKLINDMLDQAGEIASELKPEERKALHAKLEDTITSMYPFLKSSSPSAQSTPFSNLRETFQKGSKGIVIPTGKNQFRFTTHLISNIREVLHSKLPIQVAYAGEDDLPAEYRDALVSLGPDIETFDVLERVDDTTLDLKHGGWAIKPFAVLTSTFEKIILMDADSVFVQKPDIIFNEHSGFLSTGTLLFHDRLLWKDVFKERAEWWHKEMEHHTPSATLQSSKVWTEGYAEEGDSGVVALDKGQLPILMALLHICWQNSKSVREDWTYKMTYGDKESWWFGLELCSVPYKFEEHYAAILGQTQTIDNDERVCSFSIAHVGEHLKLLWYNGSLLKNKMVNQTEFSIPESWMIDAEWLKGRTKGDLSCMRGAPPRTADDSVVQIVTQSVEKAKELDQKFKDLIGPLS